MLRTYINLQYDTLHTHTRPRAHTHTRTQEALKSAGEWVRVADRLKVESLVDGAKGHYENSPTKKDFVDYLTPKGFVFEKVGTYFKL